jgi:hypothetical protein
MIDNKTTHRNYLLPHADNKLKEDVVRLNDAFVDIDTDVNDLYTTTGTLSSELTTVTQNTQNGTLWYADSTGNGTAYQVVLNPEPTVLNSGLRVHMKAHIQNTGPTTLKVNSLGIKTIKKTDGSDLKSGDILAGAACFLFYDGTNFQLINPKTDQAQTEVNASNIMRAFEEIQENHGGSLLMEAGWSDSFANPNEQGADEANSTDFQHDVVNKFYKGSDPGTDLNSDKNYDIESNFLQQEWTNANQGLSQSTFTNGSAILTLNDANDNWPNNCDRARIKNNIDGTFHEIISGQGTNTLALKSNYSGPTDTTSDWVILFSQFNSGKIKLQEADYTEDLTSGQTFSASASTSTAGNAFDDDSNTEYFVADFPKWLGVQFSSPKQITKFTLQSGSVGNNMKDWALYGSNTSAGTGGTLIATGALPSNSNVNAETFSNSSFYTFYTLNITSKYGANPTVNIREIEMMEGIGNVTNEYVSICEEKIQTTNTSPWLNISGAIVTETLSSQSAYYWLSFDPPSNYGDGTEINIFNLTGSIWRKIVRKSGATWEYNNDATNTATEDWTTSTTNDMLHAISQAIANQQANRMTGTDLAAISDAQWEEAGGWSTLVNSITRGITLHSNSAIQNPLVAQYRLNYDSERGAMELFSKN